MLCQGKDGCRGRGIKTEHAASLAIRKVEAGNLRPDRHKDVATFAVARLRERACFSRHPQGDPTPPPVRGSFAGGAPFRQVGRQDGAQQGAVMGARHRHQIGRYLIRHLYMVGHRRMRNRRTRESARAFWDPMPLYRRCQRALRRDRQARKRRRGWA